MGLAEGTAKFLVFFFNFVFFVSGCAIFGVGIAVIKKLEFLEDTLDQTPFKTAPILMIVLGAFIAIIAFFGCCGAIKGNYCMLMTFAGILIVIFIAELGIGIAAYVKQDDVIKEIKEGMQRVLKDYHEKDHNTTRKDWDNFQKEWYCCGGDQNYTQWLTPDNGCPAETKTKYDCIPDSCHCNGTDNHCGQVNVAYPSNVYTRSCYDAISSTVTENVVLIGGIGVGIAFIQILGIVLSCCLGMAVKQSHI